MKVGALTMVRMPGSSSFWGIVLSGDASVEPLFGLDWPALKTAGDRLNVLSIEPSRKSLREVLSPRKRTVGAGVCTGSKLPKEFIFLRMAGLAWAWVKLLLA